MRQNAFDRRSNARSRRRSIVDKRFVGSRRRRALVGVYKRDSARPHRTHATSRAVRPSVTVARSIRRPRATPRRATARAPRRPADSARPAARARCASGSAVAAARGGFSAVAAARGGSSAPARLFTTRPQGLGQGLDQEVLRWAKPWCGALRTSALGQGTTKPWWRLGGEKLGQVSKKGSPRKGGTSQRRASSCPAVIISRAHVTFINASSVAPSQ